MPSPGRWLLPLTVVSMAALLVVRSANLVLAAAPPAAASPVATSPAATSPSAALPPAAAAAAAAAALPPKPQPVSVVLPAEPAAEPPVSPSERALLTDLRRRKSELDAREAALAVRESLAGATEKRVAARVDQLGGLQQRLEALDAAQRGRDEASWVKMVRVYETMKAKDAAVIFDDLDMPVLLQVIDRMKDPKAAAVLAAMQPERARLLTTELAQLRLQANHLAAAPPTQAAPAQTAPAAPAPESPAKPAAGAG